MQNIIERHERIALQVSGGRDSIACLYLMRPYWDRVTVYWLDTGAAYPETVSLMQRICDMVAKARRNQGTMDLVVFPEYSLHGLSVDSNAAIMSSLDAITDELHQAEALLRR